MIKLTKVIYPIRMFLFIIQFYFIFSILHGILDLKLYGYLFLSIYTIYIIKVITELLSKKNRYKTDLIYNIMQIGCIVYILVMAIKINVNHLYVTKMTHDYFKNNFIFLSLLILFTLIYNFIELRNKKI